MESSLLSYLLTCTHRPVRRKTPRISVALCIFLLILSSSFKTHAQSGTDYAVHANIIYHFTKYINWPEDKKSGDFIIGIMGESQLFEKLKAFIANKTVGGQKIVIRKYASNAQSFNCHILFIGDEESGSLKKIATATAAGSTLIVTETEGLARKGSCINFVIVDERLKLEINKKNIEQRDLGIATELLNLGTIVR